MPDAFDDPDGRPRSAGHTEAGCLTVMSCKYDGRVHRSWRARLTERRGSLVILDGEFEEEVRHPLLGTIPHGTRSTEFYWLDRCYSIFRFAEPSGELLKYYCNVNLPPVLEAHQLKYVDLDIDILVAPDLSYSVLDEDEFELHAEQYAYPAEVRLKAREALAELVSLIENRSFPFDS